MSPLASRGQAKRATGTSWPDQVALARQLSGLAGTAVHQQDLYHVFIDFKKALDRVWHAALWATMKKYNISTSLIQVIKSLYNKATSAVLFNGTIGDWF